MTKKSFVKEIYGVTYKIKGIEDKNMKNTTLHIGHTKKL